MSLTPVSRFGRLAFLFVAFCGMAPNYASVVLRPHFGSLANWTREPKWRYIMQKINLRELYPDVYKTDIYLEVTDEVQEVFLADKRA